MNKKIGNIILGIIVLVIICILGIVLFLNSKSNNKNVLESVSSLVTTQNELENKFLIDGYTIDEPNIILDPYNVSPLTALVIFETDTLVTPKVTIKGKDKLTTYSNTFSSSKKHYLSIYGLYPDTNNEVEISYGDVSKTIYIQTSALPDDFVLPTSVMADKTKLNNDLYFYTPSSNGYTCAYDVNGDVRWYLTNYALWDNARLSNGHMLISTDRLIYEPYYMTGLYEIDLLGKIYNEYSIKGGYHHDYFEMEDGNLLVLSDDFNNDDGTVEDYVTLIDRETGNVIKNFDLKKIIPMDQGTNESWTSYDWFHNNSVWYDKETNSITLSGRHLDSVINIDFSTSKLNWIIGDPTGWSEEYQKYFFTPVGENFEWQWMQHAAMITPEGYVFIFDNGNNKSKDPDEYVLASDSYSRGVMYKIDTDKMTIEQVYEYGKELGSDFYSPYISDVDYIDSNHFIIHSGGISYKDGEVLNVPASLDHADTLKSDTVEIIDNKVVFELVLPTNNYRVEKLSLYGTDEFKLTKASRLGSLGVTKETSIKNGFMLNTKKIDDNYNNHNITFKLEEDRLEFKGTFVKGSEVDIILYKNGKKLIYDVPVSKRPYTAMCVDIFTEEENSSGINITKYINRAGLDGNYSIYLSIDGIIYNTGYVANF